LHVNTASAASGLQLRGTTSARSSLVVDSRDQRQWRGLWIHLAD
jgi:hypothetical protein